MITIESQGFQTAVKQFLVITLIVLGNARVFFGTTLVCDQSEPLQLHPSPPPENSLGKRNQIKHSTPRQGQDTLLRASHVNFGHFSTSALFPQITNLDSTLSTLPAKGLANLPELSSVTSTMSSGQQIGDHNQRSGLSQRFSNDDTRSDSGYGSISDGFVEPNASVQIFSGNAGACELPSLFACGNKRMTDVFHTSADSERRQWSSHVHQLH